MLRIYCYHHTKVDGERPNFFFRKLYTRSTFRLCMTKKLYIFPVWLVRYRVSLINGRSAGEPWPFFSDTEMKGTMNDDDGDMNYWAVLRKLGRICFRRMRDQLFRLVSRSKSIANFKSRHVLQICKMFFFLFWISPKISSIASSTEMCWSLKRRQTQALSERSIFARISPVMKSVE